MSYKKGFSLIEVLVYIAVMVIVLLIVVNTALLMTKAYQEMRLSVNMNNSAVSILERMSREARWSSSINTTDSILNNNSGLLVLNRIDGSEVTTEIRFYIENGSLVIKEGLSDAVALNAPGKVFVDKFFVTRIDSGISEMVKIEIELRGMLKDRIKMETFYDSIILRESY